MIEEYSKNIISAQGTLAKNLKEELRRIIKSLNTPILRLIGENYWDSEKYTWVKQDNQELLNSITTKLGLNNIDIFERVATQLQSNVD